MKITEHVNNIFLAGYPTTTGALNMGEVQGLKLTDAKLVVLSACSNAFRGELRSDGVIGISRAFIAAGSPTLLASLWAVNDNTIKGGDDGNAVQENDG